MLKGTNVYVNEHLSKKNADIAGFARQLHSFQFLVHVEWMRWRRLSSRCRTCHHDPGED